MAVTLVQSVAGVQAVVCADHLSPECLAAGHETYAGTLFGPSARDHIGLDAYAQQLSLTTLARIFYGDMACALVTDKYPQFRQRARWVADSMLRALYVSCLAESRYVVHQYTHFIGHAGHDIRPSPLGRFLRRLGWTGEYSPATPIRLPVGFDRDKYVENALPWGWEWFRDTFDLREVARDFRIMRSAFRATRNDGGFGGLPWAYGAELGMKFCEGKLSPVSFADAVFDQVHNGAPILNKVFVDDDSRAFLEFRKLAPPSRIALWALQETRQAYGLPRLRFTLPNELAKVALEHLRGASVNNRVLRDYLQRAWEKKRPDRPSPLESATTIEAYAWLIAKRRRTGLVPPSWARTEMHFIFPAEEHDWWRACMTPASVRDAVDVAKSQYAAYFSPDATNEWARDRGYTLSSRLRAKDNCPICRSVGVLEGSRLNTLVDDDEIEQCQDCGNDLEDTCCGKLDSYGLCCDCQIVCSGCDEHFPSDADLYEGKCESCCTVECHDCSTEILTYSDDAYVDDHTGEYHCQDCVRICEDCSETLMDCYAVDYNDDMLCQACYVKRLEDEEAEEAEEADSPVVTQ